MDNRARDWHPETLFLVAALSEQIGIEDLVPRSVAVDAFQRSTRLAEWAARHKLIGPVADLARQLDLPHERLKALHQQSALNAMRTAAFSGEAFEVLREAGCHPLLIKGVVLAVITGDSVVGRGAGDVDIAVAPREIPAALDAFREVGAVVTTSPEVNWRMHAVNLQWGGTHIDLHHRFDKSPYIGVSFDALWERGMNVDIAGHPVRTLSLADTTIHAAVHAGMDTWSQLGRIADFQRLQAKVDPDDLERAAREWGGQHLLSVARAVLRRVAGGQPERPIAEALARQAWLWLAQGRQLRLDQDDKSRYEREGFRIAATGSARFVAWTLLRNSTRPWDHTTDWAS